VRFKSLDFFDEKSIQIAIEISGLNRPTLIKTIS